MWFLDTKSVDVLPLLLAARLCYVRGERSVTIINVNTVTVVGPHRNIKMRTGPIFYNNSSSAPMYHVVNYSIVPRNHDSLLPRHQKKKHKLSWRKGWNFAPRLLAVVQGVVWRDGGDWWLSVLKVSVMTLLMMSCVCSWWIDNGRLPRCCCCCRPPRLSPQQFYFQ